MLGSKTFLALDVGAGSVKAAEFSLTEAGTLGLKKFGIKSVGLEGSQDATRQAVVQKILQELVAERGFTAKTVNVCAPGYQVFSKYVKLPPVDNTKVTQIVQYEAQQNVPFPLEEVVWDYQIVGNTPSGELEVLLVAIKSDIVEGLFRIAASVGMRMQLVDASPAALCNAFRFSYGDLDGCSMLLDIGAKTSNVLFFEKGKYSTRSINIGANAITQDFSTEARLPFASAEKFKIAEGFVSLGGAYEEPENPRQAQISKIARQVMTRLHLQINQTLNFYRSQQGGGAPQRLFLAGGASLMPYTAQFFQEKLNLPVEYFNPLKNVQIDPSVNLEELAKVAHCFGEVVGLGLRNMAQCPVELNLMPKSIRKKQQINQKKPYFIATAASMVLGLAAVGWFYDSRVVSAKVDLENQLTAALTPLEQQNAKMQLVLQQNDAVKKQLDQFTQSMDERFYWLNLLTQLREALQETEAKNQEPGFKTGVWIEQFTPTAPDFGSSVNVTSAASEDSEADASRAATRAFYMSDPALRRRYGLDKAPATDGQDAAAGDASATTKAAPTNEVNTVEITCRAVNLKKTPESNFRLAQTLLQEIKARTNWFVPNETAFVGEIKVADESAGTFNFKITLKLAHPVKL
jgi:type IV pilus assembly protein PilM